MDTAMVRRYIFPDRDSDMEDSDLYLCDECVMLRRATYHYDGTPIWVKFEGEWVEWIADSGRFDEPKCEDCGATHGEHLDEED